MPYQNIKRNVQLSLGGGSVQDPIFSGDTDDTIRVINLILTINIKIRQAIANKQISQEKVNQIFNETLHQIFLNAGFDQIDSRLEFTGVYDSCIYGIPRYYEYIFRTVLKHIDAASLTEVRATIKESTKEHLLYYCQHCQIAMGDSQKHCSNCGRIRFSKLS